MSKPTMTRPPPAQTPARPARPSAPSVDNIPDELKARHQWVVWRYEWRGKKWTKIPYQPAYPAWKAKADDPATWSTFDAAWSTFLAAAFDGIGYEFSANDPYCGIDFDGCLDNGNLVEWARTWLSELSGAYAEISPSGCGIKIIVRATLPGSGGARPVGDDSHSGIEIYDRGRFFTITGNLWIPQS